MIIGAISDTHEDRRGVIPRIMKEFEERNVELIVHCGDIEKEHVDSDLFLGLPVICALTDEQEEEKEEFQQLEPEWTFTIPGKRIVKHEKIKMYVGHKRSFDFLTGSEEDVIEFLNTIRKENDGLRLVFGGHTHHQVLIQARLINFINPGAVERSLSGSYEFAVINTENQQITFDRLLPTNPTIPEFKIAVIADTSRISKMDPDFWSLLTKEFKQKGVENIVHCNIYPEDVGRVELEEFTVYFNLFNNQELEDSKVPRNWVKIPKDDPIEINDYKFYVKQELGADLWEQSETDMHDFCLNLRKKYGELDAIFCGGTNDALYAWEERTKILNPGDTIIDRGYMILSLPSYKVTFGRVPLPELSS